MRFCSHPWSTLATKLTRKVSMLFQAKWKQFFKLQPQITYRNPTIRSFLGLLNYYWKFIPSLATLIHPLDSLLQHAKPWAWTKRCSQAFQQAKEALSSSSVLVHYDPTLPITLAGDASAYGIGAVISHTLPDGTKKPIAFASRSLTSSERNYAQLEKEALSLIFGVNKFHQYLYGRKFHLITDHKPLTAILGSKKGIPSLAAARLHSWPMFAVPEGPRSNQSTRVGHELEGVQKLQGGGSISYRKIWTGDPITTGVHILRDSSKERTSTSLTKLYKFAVLSLE